MLRPLCRRWFSTPVTMSILEPGQIADWVIEQMEHKFVFNQSGRCESVSYDMSGNTWKRFELLDAKLKDKKNLARILDNMTEIIHMDDCGLDDFDALVLSKLLRFKCDKARLLDLNNNPSIKDMGLAHIARHILAPSSPVQLRSLFLSGCGITDEGVSYLLDPLAWPEQSMHILELRKNQIGDTGAELLAKVLGKPNAVRAHQFSLFLNNNTNITEKGVLALAKAVIEAEGGLKVHLKDVCPDLSAADKADVMRVTKNRLRF